jgi:hypothetical protein
VDVARAAQALVPRVAPSFLKSKEFHIIRVRTPLKALTSIKYPVNSAQVKSEKSVEINSLQV